MIAGDFFDIYSDGVYNLSRSNLVDLLERKGISWKTYQEGYPGTSCSGAAIIGKYWRKHNPFMSFDNIRQSPSRCKCIVNSAVLDQDLDAGTLPQYMFFTPNIDNDGHDTTIAFAGNWLNNFMGPRLKKFPNGTLFVVTWDEDDYSLNNHIYTSIFGSMIQGGSVDDTNYSHYSLLSTVEQNWGLGSLNRNDSIATPFKFN